MQILCPNAGNQSILFHVFQTSFARLINKQDPIVNVGSFYVRCITVLFFEREPTFVTMRLKL